MVRSQRARGLPAQVGLQWGNSQGPGLRACPCGTFWVLGSRLSTQHLCGPHSCRGDEWSLLGISGFQKSPAPAGSGWGSGGPSGLLPRPGPLGRQQAPSQLGTCPDGALRGLLSRHWLLDTKLPHGLVLWGLSGCWQCLGEVGLRRSPQSLGS